MSNQIDFKWYVVVNDLVGGWGISNVDKPYSQHNFKSGDVMLGEFISKPLAEYVVALHNEARFMPEMLELLEQVLKSPTRFNGVRSEPFGSPEPRGVYSYSAKELRSELLDRIRAVVKR